MTKGHLGDPKKSEEEKGVASTNLNCLFEL